MTVIATCDQCGEHRCCKCGITAQPVMPDHRNPKTGEHCPGSNQPALTGVQ